MSMVFPCQNFFVDLLYKYFLLQPNTSNSIILEERFILFVLFC